MYYIPVNLHNLTFDGVVYPLPTGNTPGAWLEPRPLFQGGPYMVYTVDGLIDHLECAVYSAEVDGRVAQKPTIGLLGDTITVITAERIRLTRKFSAWTPAFLARLVLCFAGHTLPAIREEARPTMQDAVNYAGNLLDRMERVSMQHHLSLMGAWCEQLIGDSYRASRACFKAVSAAQSILCPEIYADPGYLAQGALRYAGAISGERAWQRTMLARLLAFVDRPAASTDPDPAPVR